MKSIFASRQAKVEPHPLEATTVWREYQKAKEHQQSKAASARIKKLAVIALAAIAVVGIGVALVMLLPLRSSAPTLPTDAKARSEFVDALGSKLSEEDKRLLSRFLARLQAQQSAGGSVPPVTVAAAIERQREYDREVTELQKRIQTQLDAAKGSLGVNVRDQAIVRTDGKSSSGKSLRYVLEVANRDKRTVDAMGLRVEFRDPSRKYVAAVPTLDLKGPLVAGETGRSVQMLPLDASYHQYILDGGAILISAYPTQVGFADGEKIDAETELKRLESLARTKIE